MKREKTYEFSTEGLNECLADIRAEKSRYIINRNTTISLVVLFVALAALSTGGASTAFTYTVYKAIPALPMPLIP